MKKARIVCVGILMSLSASANKDDGNTPQGGAAFGSIAAGTATFEVTSWDSGLDWRTNLTVSDGPVAGDRLWASGWAYRLAGGTQESNLGIPDSSSYNGNIAYYEWNNVNNLGVFKANMVVELTQPVAGEAVLLKVLSIENISNAPITIDIFSYEDFDINATFTNDTAALTNDPDYITVIDTADLAEYRGGGNDSYQVTVFQELLLALEDVGITNFDNTGLPFGPGDFTAGFQWSGIEIPRFGVYTLETVSSFGGLAPVPDPPVLFDDVLFRDGFDINVPPVL